LNKVTKQVDVDILDNNGNKIKVEGLKFNIEIIVERMGYKDPAVVNIPRKKPNLFLMI
jgi:hypothetical protein